MSAIDEPDNLEEPLQTERLRAHRAARRARRASANRALTWNVLTVLVWLSMAFVVMAFITVYANPQSSINPLRPIPPTLVAAVDIPTMTPSPLPSATLTPLDPTASPTVTPTPVTPTPTRSPSPTITETPTEGPSPTATVHSLYPFILRGEVKTLAGATFPEHDTCKLWVAGQAYDLQGAPMTGITVMLGGYLDGKTLYQLSLTGTALQYGQAGYEFTVADKPVKSKQSVWVELFDQAMYPLSGKIYFDTVEDCQQNLILINFRQIR